MRIAANGDLISALDGGEVRLRKPVVYQPGGASLTVALATDGKSAATTGNLKSQIANSRLIEGRYVLRPAESEKGRFEISDFKAAESEKGKFEISDFKAAERERGTFEISDLKFEIAFELAAYDPSLPLIIDPVLSYSTYLGGSNDDGAEGIAVDSSGSAYVTGYTYSANFPTSSGAYDTSCGTDGACNLLYDAFVTKLNADGSDKVYSTYLGGSGPDYAYGIAVDSSGNASVTGLTTSVDFPGANAYDSTCGTDGTCNGGLNIDGFVTKLNAGGTALVFSTYLGGSSDEWGNAVAMDSGGNVYVVGPAGSSDFPTTTTAFQPGFAGVEDAFFSKFDPIGAFLYSTFLGGNQIDHGMGIAVDSSGMVYVSGHTQSFDFPTSTGAYQTLHAGLAGDADAFAAKFDPTLSGAASRIYATFLGGAGNDYSLAVAVDSSGNAFLTGETLATAFSSVPSSWDGACGTDGTCNGGFQSDAFVVKLNPTGTALVYWTYLGASSFDYGYGIAVDSSGDAYVTGTTYSTDFPAISAIQVLNAGSTDAFVSRFDSTGSSLLFSTYHGGSNFDDGRGIAVDGSGHALVVGLTGSTDFPTTAGAFDTTCGTDGTCNFDGEVSYSDAFVSKMTTAAGPAVTLSPTALSFGNQAVGSTSAAQTVTLINDGDAVLNFSSMTITGDFAETNTCGTTLPAGSSCAFDVTFSPTATGPASGNLTINSDAPGSPHVVTLSGTGIVGPAVSLSASSLSFGSQTVATTSAPQALTLTNTGAATLNISSITVSGDFALTHDCPAALGANLSCAISVTFTPTAVGTRTGVVTVVSDAPGSPHAVALAGTGLAGPAVAVSPASIHFPGNPLNIDCPAKIVTLTNTGDAPLAITGIVTSAEFSETNTCGSSLAAGASCAISIKFRPTQVGLKEGTLTITSDAPGSPHTVALSGNGTPPCLLLSSAQSVKVVRSSTEANFTISDQNPSCSPVAIELSCSRADPARCEFSPAIIPPTGTSTLRLTNLRAVVADTLNFLVTGRSEFRVASLGLTVLLQDFAFTSAPATATVQAGETATYALALRPVHGLSGEVALTCSGAPPGATCTVSPARVTLDGLNLAFARVTVQTTARSTAPPPAPRTHGSWPASPWLWVGALAALLLVAAKSRRARGELCATRLRGMALPAGLLMVALWAACGGGGWRLSGVRGTPAGTTTLTITGTFMGAGSSTPSEALVQTTELTLTVQ